MSTILSHQPAFHCSKTQGHHVNDFGSGLIIAAQWTILEPCIIHNNITYYGCIVHKLKVWYHSMFFTLKPSRLGTSLSYILCKSSSYFVIQFYASDSKPPTIYRPINNMDAAVPCRIQKPIAAISNTTSWWAFIAKQHTWPRTTR